jgi:hypothetical protein
MSEWMKILVTALSAFAVGTLLEPVRACISMRLQARGLRRALYAELTDFHELATTCTECAEGSKQRQYYSDLLKNFPFDTYKYAKTKPDIFYSLTEAQEWDAMIHGWNSSSAKEDQDRDGLAEYVLHGIGIALLYGDHSEKLFRKANAEVYKAYLQRKQHLSEEVSLCHRCLSEMEIKTPVAKD